MFNEIEKRKAIEGGVVKWFDVHKGFGFIMRAGKDDVFLYYKDIIMPGFKVLYEGDVVEFEIMNTEKGIKAVNVVKIR